MKDETILSLNEYVELCHGNAKAAGWHNKPREKGTELMLIVSEVAEAMEGERKGSMDDKLPHRSQAEVELADVVIRVFDYCGKYGYDLQGAVNEKIAFNQTREDHKLENREKPGGKQF